MHVIATRRLRLVSLDAAFWSDCLAGELERAGRHRGIRLSRHWLEELGEEVFTLRRDQLLRAPEGEPWLTRAVALANTGEAVGAVGFHGPPGGDWLEPYAPGGVEFGYSVFEPHRRRGYAAEASRALMEWAVRKSGVSGFVLSIGPSNVPSKRLADALGFERVGEWSHPSRGRELVYRRVVSVGPVRRGVAPDGAGSDR